MTSACGPQTDLGHVVGPGEPDAGAVEVDGQAVHELERPALMALRMQIGVVFQFAALLDSMTVRDNVALGLRRRPLSAGDIQARVREALAETVEATRANRAMTVALALSYGGRQDIVAAMRKIADAVRSGELVPDEIDEDIIGRALTTGELPDPDLLIRTSGELRISNFFLYQLAYTELYFTDVLWPDFRERELLRALAAYQSRERRFGTISPG